MPNYDSILAKHVTQENPAVTFIVRGEGTTTVPKPAVEGDQVVIPYNTPVTLPRSYFDVVRGAGFDATLLSDGDEPSEAPEAPAETLGGGSDASAGGSGNEPGSGNSAPAFDADAVIAGNVGDVVARLAALSDAELAAVKAAEIDREKPRSSVTKAIEAEITERKAKAAEQSGDGA
ncbi:hypothetical protein [Sphingopyxis flava]|uniref:Uncharacterized protein n=1 Tax=Sphingopyxis flava TaxID=1507287 RepID=A0A1T5ABW2_9SPHN|nr:hypothetical protein [Sphingopyxis flava]SKB32385.1 hypothetical protein SAMN06295937_100375 [Sphingopyxis flava]